MNNAWTRIANSSDTCQATILLRLHIVSHGLVVARIDKKGLPGVCPQKSAILAIPVTTKVCQALGMRCKLSLPVILPDLDVNSRHLNTYPVTVFGPVKPGDRFLRNLSRYKLHSVRWWSSDVRYVLYLYFSLYYVYVRNTTKDLYRCDLLASLMNTLCAFESGRKELGLHPAIMDICIVYLLVQFNVHQLSGRRIYGAEPSSQ